MSYVATATTKSVISPSLAVTRGLGSYTYAPPGIGKTFTWTNGTGANQINKVYENSRSITASSNDDLDLAGGALTDIEGAVITFTALKSIYIENTSATQTLTVGVGSNPFVGVLGGTTPTMIIPPLGIFHVENPSAAGWPVTAGTGDILRIANGAGSTAVAKVCLMGI